MYRFILADTETTGIKTSDMVCEVAYREVDANLETVGEGQSLINPGMPIHYAASAVNGITDAMVADAPTLPDYFAAQGNPLVGENVVLVCHNAAFDHRFLSPHMTEGSQTLCTLKCARIVYPDAENHKQSTLAAMLGISVPREKAHSADGDLDVLHQLLVCLCRDAGCSIEGLLEVQTRKRKIKSMPFGKHRGKALADLPDDYVHWLLHKAENLDGDLRASLMEI
jgi:DNA polymerase III epsilon subunit-like protein